MNYINAEYEPKFNDFGDDYFLDDTTDQEDDLLFAVKKIRKRYVNYFDFLDAVELYDKYMDRLYEKYGGKKGFKMSLLLREVNEYIPHYPELKLNKRNKVLYLKRATRESVKENGYSFTNFESCETQNDKADKVVPTKVDVKLNDSNMITNMMHQLEISSNISKADAIESLQRLEIDNLNLQAQINSIRRNSRIGNKKKHKLINKTLRRKTLYSYSTTYYGITDILNMVDKYEKDKFYNIDPYSSEVINHKGATMTKREAEEIDTLLLLKSLGVTSRVLRRREMKVTRRKKKDYKRDKKMKKKMNKLKDENDMIYDLTHGEYDDFAAYEEAMINYKSEKRWK